MASPQPHRRLPSPQRPLAGRYFHDPDIFAKEQRVLFQDRWLCAGHTSELNQVGDFFTKTLAQDPLLFSRAADGIRGFYNVCRHRGTRVVSTPCGRGAKNFQCPYHAWTYGLDGRLLGAPRMKSVDGFDPSQAGLVEVETAEWNGFLFFKSQAPGSPPDRYSESTVHDQLHDFPDMSPYSGEELVGAARRVYDVAVNWKLLCHNFGECYHCALIHPQLNDISQYLSGGEQLSGSCFVGGPMKLEPECTTMSMTGVSDRQPLPRVTGEAERHVYFYHLYPNLFLSLHPDYVISHQLWPTGPQTTTIVCDWLFHREAVAEPGFDISGEIEFWDTTNRQDWAVCEQTQLGMTSSGYRPMAYHSGESCLAEFDRWYLSATKD